MDPQVKLIDDMDRMTYSFLRTNLGGITDEELDWRPHRQANTVRWIIAHLVWIEEWASDAIEGTGMYVSETWPSAVDRSIPFDELLGRFDVARERYSGLLTALQADDLARELDYFGEFTTTLRGLAAIHSLHMSGHQYQVRYIRGTFSRDRGTEKAAFDPW